ncbi:MAG TPA: cell division protein ZipA C-terminal FtsZ-binding domain-containing protein [Methylococcus sp.]|nr:cell division protein ZipA C-terminal FtsZ-binding domain-containing protein [Methylococcus sp.]
MDRDTVRIILLVVGVVIIAGVYVWGRFKPRILDLMARRDEFDELTAEEDRFAQAESGSDEEFGGQTTGVPAAEEEVRPYSSEVQGARVSAPREASGGPQEVGKERATALGAPFIIQLNVVSEGREWFRGEDLRDALIDLDLVYGEMGIFHRYDPEYREPLFSVASLVEPGTFPVSDMGSFRCPGVVFFFQPAKVPNPMEVFDDLVDTCRALAAALGGTIRDQNRARVSESAIVQMRERLAEACERP